MQPIIMTKYFAIEMRFFRISYKKISPNMTERINALHSLLLDASCSNILAEKKFEYCTYQRLYEKQL